MELYKKYRPKSFSEIEGNSATIESLQKALEADRFPQTILFTGDRGTGKTTIALIIAQLLGADSLSTHHINCSSENGVDDARAITEALLYPSLGGKPTVYFIDECHFASANWQAAMLKSLEFTPENVYFILGTTNPQKLKKDLRSRCQEYKLESLGSKDLLRVLNRIKKAENLKVPRTILTEIVKVAEGSSRVAIQALDKIALLEDEEAMKKAIHSITDEGEASIIDLARLLCRGGTPWKKLCPILSDLKKSSVEPETIRRTVLGYAQSILLKGPNEQCAKVLECFLDPTYDAGFPAIILSCWQVEE